MTGLTTNSEILGLSIAESGTLALKNNTPVEQSVVVAQKTHRINIITLLCTFAIESDATNIVTEPYLELVIPLQHYMTTQLGQISNNHWNLFTQHVLQRLHR